MLLFMLPVWMTLWSLVVHCCWVYSLLEPLELLFGVFEHLPLVVELPGAPSNLVALLLLLTTPCKGRLLVEESYTVDCHVCYSVAMDTSGGYGHRCTLVVGVVVG